MDVLTRARALLTSLNQSVRAIKKVQKQIDAADKTKTEELENLYAMEFKFAMEISAVFESIMLLMDREPGTFALRRIKQQVDTLMGEYYDVI